MSAIDLPAWRDLLKKYLTKRGRKHWPHLAVCIHAVGKHWKPAYLVDSVSVSEVQLQRLLQEAVAVQLVPSTVSVVVIGSEIFVTDWPYLQTYLEEIRASRDQFYPRFVDISVEKSQAVVAVCDEVIPWIIQELSAALTLDGPRDPWPIDPRDTGPIDPRDTGPIDPRDTGPIDPRAPGPIDPRDPGPIGPRDPVPIDPRAPVVPIDPRAPVPNDPTAPVPIIRLLFEGEAVPLPSVYGLLVGYPLVYYFNPLSDPSGQAGRCLVGETVVCCGVDVVIDDMHHTLYSFTYPEILQSQLEPVVTAWIKRLTQLFPAVQFVCKNKMEVMMAVNL